MASPVTAGSGGGSPVVSPVVNPASRLSPANSSYAVSGASGFVGVSSTKSLPGSTPSATDVSPRRSSSGSAGAGRTSTTTSSGTSVSPSVGAVRCSGAAQVQAAAGRGATSSEETARRPD